MPKPDAFIRIILLLVSASLFAQQTGRENLVELPSARSAAVGGIHAALADDLDTLFSNPAGFRSAGPEFSIAEITLALSGPIFDITSVMIEGMGGDPSGLLSDPEVQDLMKNLYAAMKLVGPVSFGYVGNGVGFGFFNRSYARVSTRGTVPTVTISAGGGLSFAGGYALRVTPASWKSSMDIGALIRASFNADSTVDKDLLSFFSAFSDPLGLIVNAPFRIGLGVAFDAGLLYSYKNRFSFGVVGRNLYAPVLYYDYASLQSFLGSGAPISSTDLEPIDLSAGILFRPPLGFLSRYISDLKLMLDYQDILDFLTHPLTSSNPILHAGIGIELVLLEILSIRGGFYQGLFSGGLGFDLSLFQLNLAMFGSELSPEPGLRPVFNLLLEVAFRL